MVNGIETLELAIKNAKTLECDGFCRDCRFVYEGENGGYDCVLEKMERLLDYVKQNNN